MIHVTRGAAVRLVVVAALVCLGAAALGHLQMPDPALAGFDAVCRAENRPCWQGIVPGVTLIGEAREVVEGLGYQPDNSNIELSDRVFVYRSEALRPGCIDVYYVPATGLVESVVLRCSTVSIGEVMVQAGKPTERWGRLNIYEALYYRQRMVVTLRYGQGQITPGHTVDAIYVRAQEKNLFNPPLAIGWHGFAPVWRYCQLEADFPLC